MYPNTYFYESKCKIKKKQKNQNINFKKYIVEQNLDVQSDSGSDGWPGRLLIMRLVAGISATARIDCFVVDSSCFFFSSFSRKTGFQMLMKHHYI